MNILKSSTSNKENQDYGAIFVSEARTLLVIADGAGGSGNGTEAAHAAINFIHDHMNQLTDKDSCIKILNDLDLMLALNPRGGETTGAIAVIDQNQIFGASIGDSAIWLIDPFSFIDLTEYQIRKPLLGSGKASAVGFKQSTGNFKHLLLGTDGLFKYTTSEKIISICQNPDLENTASNLIEAVRYKSRQLPDDITVILHQF